MMLVSLFFSLALGAGPAGVGAPAADAWVPVASYLNQPDRVVDAAMAELHAAGIDEVSVGSLGMTVSVKASQVTRARTILGVAAYHDHVYVLTAADLRGMQLP